MAKELIIFFFFLINRIILIKLKGKEPVLFYIFYITWAKKPPQDTAEIPV